MLDLVRHLRAPQQHSDAESMEKAPAQCTVSSVELSSLSMKTLAEPCLSGAETRFKAQSGGHLFHSAS